MGHHGIWISYPSTKFLSKSVNFERLKPHRLVGGWVIVVVVVVVVVVVNWDSLWGHSSYARWLWQNFDLAKPSTFLQSMRTLYHLHHLLSQDQSTPVDLTCLSARWSHSLFDLPVHHTCAVVQIKSEFYTKKEKLRFVQSPHLLSQFLRDGFWAGQERDNNLPEKKKKKLDREHTHTHAHAHTQEEVKYP
jgi:hypothetical protein